MERLPLLFRIPGWVLVPAVCLTSLLFIARSFSFSLSVSPSFLTHNEHHSPPGDRFHLKYEVLVKCLNLTYALIFYWTDPFLHTKSFPYNPNPPPGADFHLCDSWEWQCTFWKRLLLIAKPHWLSRLISVAPDTCILSPYPSLTKGIESLRLFIVEDHEVSSPLPCGGDLPRCHLHTIPISKSTVTCSTPFVGLRTQKAAIL